MIKEHQNFALNNWEEELKAILEENKDYCEHVVKAINYLVDNINTDELNDLIRIADLCASKNENVLRYFYRTIKNEPFSFKEHKWTGRLEVKHVLYPYRSHVVQNWNRFCKKYEKILRS